MTPRQARRAANGPWPRVPLTLAGWPVVTVAPVGRTGDGRQLGTDAAGNLRIGRHP